MDVIIGVRLKLWWADSQYQARVRCGRAGW